MDSKHPKLDALKAMRERSVLEEQGRQERVVRPPLLSTQITRGMPAVTRPRPKKKPRRHK